MSDGPKELQPWMRGVSKEMGELRQRNRTLENKLAAPRRSKIYAEYASLDSSTNGIVTSDYQRVYTLNGPGFQVALSGPVLVTVTAHVRAIRFDNTIAPAAYGSAVVIIDNAVPSLPAELETLARYWAFTGFRFGISATLDDQAQARTISVTRPLVLGKGTHSFRCDFLYRHLTTNIQLEWTKRSLIVEEI